MKATWDLWIDQIWRNKQVVGIIHTHAGSCNNYKKKTTSYFVRLRKILWTKTSADKNSPRKHTFNSQASLVMGKLPFHGICALETVVFLKKVKWCDAFNKIQLDNLFPLEVEKFNMKKVCYWLSLLSFFCLH